MKYTLILILFFSSFLAVAETKLDKMFLYLPDHVIQERLADQQRFMEYIGSVKTVLFNELDKGAKDLKFSFSLIVGVRPKNQSKVWLKFIDGSFDSKLTSRITKAIESIPAPDVIGGVMPFSIAVYSDSSTERFVEPPIHDSWFKNGKGGEISELINSAWN